MEDSLTLLILLSNINKFKLHLSHSILAEKLSSKIQVAGAFAEKCYSHKSDNEMGAAGNQVHENH